MAGFIERHTSDPSIEDLTEIEGIDIVEIPGQLQIQALGQGTVGFAGEFLKWKPDPIEVFGVKDMISKLGGWSKNVGDFRFVTINGKKYLQCEGNAFLKLQSGHKFKRLVCIPVDDSVGTVDFSRSNPGFGQAKSAVGPFNLIGQGISTGDQTDIEFDGDNAKQVAVVFNFTKAQLASTSVGSFADVGAGKDLVIEINGQTYIVTTAGGENNQALWQTLIDNNLPAAVVTTDLPDANSIRFNTVREGTGASVKISPDSHDDVLAAIGFADNDTAVGTGNVFDATAVTAKEFCDIYDAAANAENGTCSDEAGAIVVTTKTSGGGGSVQILNTSDVDRSFGGDFFSNALKSGGAGSPGKLTIPAGTLLEDATGLQKYMTMQDAVMKAAEGDDAAELSASGIKVRALPGTTATAIGTIDTIASTIDADANDKLDLAVNQPGGLSTRPSSEAEWASLYSDAFDKCLEDSKPINEINVFVSARSSATDFTAASRTIQQLLKDMNAQRAVDGRGCMAPISPPLGTAKATQSTDATGNTIGNDERTIYCGIGGRVFFKQLLDDFPDSEGLCDITSDVGMASVLSQLGPEFNPGQATDFLKFKGLESATKSGGAIGPLIKADYKAFLRDGIAALRDDPDVGFVFQSGITTSTNKKKKNINRRRMADFIQDSLAAGLKPLSKTLGKAERQNAMYTAIVKFLKALRSVNDPKFQRIENYSVDTEANTPDLAKEGITIFDIAVVMLKTNDNIVLRSDIGADVEIQEAA